MLNLNNAFNHCSIKLDKQDIFYACEYRKIWFSKSIDYVNGYVTYGEKCISIPYGEDMEKLRMHLQNVSKPVQILTERKLQQSNLRPLSLKRF